MTLGYYIKSLGFGSLKEVAEQTGVTERTLQNWWNRQDLREDVLKPRLNSILNNKVKS